MTYDIIIGIETHIQLNTATKMFCRCSADAWKVEPNTRTCPVCLGLPGALPVINKAALDKAMLVGLALHAEIAESAHFDRKNYFYPDLAKGYQISQYDQPLNVGGYVEVDGEKIGLIRAHLEEDVGKLSHDGTKSLVDFNKGGTPLLEIVSEPVIRSAAQAKAYVQALRQLVRYLGVNDGDLEKGQMRADVNISLQQPGKWSYADGKFTTVDGYAMNNRVEIKNLNSFRAIERAIEYEVKLQAKRLDAGETIDQETKGWDEAKGVTTSQRSKEEAHDYRYFPEPDLPPLDISREWVSELESMLPELPAAKKQRFMDEYGLSEYDARLLTDERQTAEWFEQAVDAFAETANRKPQTANVAKMVANWVLGELSRLQNESGTPIYQSKLLPAQLASVLHLVEEGKINGATAKAIVAETFVDGIDPLAAIKERGLEQVSGADTLEPIAKQVLDENPDAVANFKAGKESVVMFLVGQVMKASKGQANPAVVKELLLKLLK